MKLQSESFIPKTRVLRSDTARKIADYILGAIIIVPAVLIVFIEYVVPFFRSLVTSLMVDNAFSLANYEVVKTQYLENIFYTIFLSVTSLFFVMLISVIVGGYLSIHTDKVIEFFFKIPLFIPFVVVGHAMRVFLAPKGLLNVLLAQIGLIDINNPPEIAFGAVGTIVALTWKQMAFALLLVMGAFRTVDKSYLEAARNFGASSLKQIRDILIPLSLPTIGVSAILIFTSFLQNFSVVMMMGKGSGPRHIMIDIYHRITYLNDLGVANALGTVSYILALGAAIIYLKRVLKKND
jgi:putative spermidine/putrescine transport system permease protein